MSLFVSFKNSLNRINRIKILLSFVLLIISIAIMIFVLSALMEDGIPNSKHMGKNAYTIRAIELMGFAVVDFKQDTGRYPKSLHECKSLPKVAHYFDGITFEDSWGHTIIYKATETNYVLISVGPDGQEGTKDDIYKTRL